MKSIKNERVLIILFGDICIMVISFFAMVFIGFSKVKPETISTHAIPFTILYATWILVFFLFDLYNLHAIRATINTFTKQLYALLTITIIAMLFFYVFSFFGIHPKSNLLINIAIFSTLFLAWRRFSLIALGKYSKQKIYIVGTSNASLLLREDINKNRHFGFIAISVDSPNEVPSSNDLKEIVVVDNTIPDKDINDLLRGNYVVLDIATAYERWFSKIPVEILNEKWIVYRLQSKLTETQEYAARLISIIFSIIITIITSPLWIIASIAIIIDDKGPIFYKQTRLGKNKKPFQLVKFRSMKVDAENDGVKWADEEDKRVTRVGKFLRRSHIDELPQMWNMFLGDISLVGPRPERPEFIKILEKEIPHYYLRHLVKPGFTGWAQIKYAYARTVSDSEEKFRYDLYYIKNANLLLDVSIILKTIQILFKKH